MISLICLSTTVIHKQIYLTILHTSFVIYLEAAVRFKNNVFIKCMHT